MKIGIISDTHDNIKDTKKALELFKKEKVKTIIHSGDLTAPFMIDIIDKYNIKTHLVFGNIDDRFLTTKKSLESKNIVLHGNIAEIKIQGKKFFINHFPKIAELAYKTKEYDYVIYGHTHKKDLRKNNKTTIINSGEILGRFKEKTIAILDLKTKKVEFYKIE